METSPEHNAQRHFSDVRENAPRGLKGLFRRGTHVVNLRPPRWVKHGLAALSILLILSVTLFGARYFLTRGEVADFHPITCLGTWQNPQAAQGPPESTFGDRPIDAETSARLGDSTGEIFCGGFVPADFETKGDLTGAALTLVWKLEGADVVTPEPIMVTSTATSTEPDASSTAPISYFIPFALAQETPSPEPSPTPAPAEETAPEIPPTEPPAEPVVPPAETTSTEQEIIIGPPLGLDLEPLVSSTVVSSTPTEVILPLPPPPDDNFLKVSYSLDGQTWYELQKVNLTNWPNLTVPLPVTAWGDLKRVQVSVQGIPSVLQSLPEVYLDGILIEAQYELPPFGGEEDAADPNAADLPVLLLPKDRKAVPAELRKNPTFRADEAATFDFDLDSLPDSPDELPPPPPPETDSPAEGSLAPAGLDLSKVRRTPPPPKGWLNFFLDSLGLGPSVSAQMDPADYTKPPSIPTTRNPVVSEIIGPDGGTDLKPVLLTVGKQLRVSVPEPKQKLRPGRYRLRLWMLRNGAIYYSESDFTWGVLAVNFNKTIYTAGDTAQFSYGVLDDNGHTICDAKIETVVTAPGGGTSVLTTENGGVKRSPECGPITVTNIPDYSSVFKPGATGVYSVRVTAITDHGPRELVDKFEVQTEPEFDIERTGPTRIYPLARYWMNIKIKANKHFRGQFTEIIPDTFAAFTNGAQKDDGNGAKILEWELDVAPGDEIELSYEFDAPDVSPELFKLGPASLGHFSETRQWQIASDAVQALGRLFYGDTTNVGTIKFQTRSNTDTWSTEASSTITPAASNIQWLWAQHAPTRDEVFIGTLHANNTFGMTKCIGNCDSSADFTGDTGDNFTISGIHNGTVTCTNILGLCTRPFDLAYEQLSGDALVIFATGTNGMLRYCTFNGTSWSGSNCATPSTTTFSGATSRFEWVQLVPEGGEQLTENRTNRILLIAMDGGRHLFAKIWDGTQWTSEIRLSDSGSGGSVTSTRNFAGAWESKGSQRAMVAWGGDGTGASTTQGLYRTWSSSTGWSASSSIGTFAESSINRWMGMASDPKSDSICLVTQGDGDGVKGWMWSATSSDGWDSGNADTTGAEGDLNQAIMCAWEKTNGGLSTSSAVFVLTDQAATDGSDYFTWTNHDGVSTWGATTDWPGAGGDDAMGFTAAGMRGAPNGDTIMAVQINIDCDLLSNYWATSTWNLAAPINDPAGTTVGGDNIPPDCTANLGSEIFGYYFLFNPYSAWSRNWQFFTDETSTTPSVAAAGQNVRPTSTIQKGNVFRLRMNVQELANTAETDARKKLQWVASTTCPDPDVCSSSDWTDVGNPNETGVVFRYATTSEICAGCADGTVLSTTVLTSSTQTSTLVMSKDATPATDMDFNALATTEIDFPIKALNATSGVVYYFRIYDATDETVNFRRQDTGQTPCAGGTTCTYPSVLMSAEPNVAPSVSNMSFNGGNAITLTPNTTTSIRVNFRVTDTNSQGCNDVFTSGGVTTTVFRSGVTSACSSNALNCYIQATTTHNCSGGSAADATTTMSVYYFAQATDASSSFPSENWIAQVIVRDGANATATATSSVELNSLVALEVSTSSISYGQLSPGTNTTSTNQTLPIKNAGNSSTSLNISGTALSSGGFALPTSSQHYATSTFTFGGLEQLLSDVATAVAGFVIPRPPLTKWATTTPMQDTLYHHSTVAYGRYLYTIGGNSSVSNTSTVRYAPINANGTLGSWATTTPMQDRLLAHSAVVNNDFLYVTGGEDSAALTSTVRYAPINANGTLGSWATTTPMQSILSSHSAVAYNGYLYVTGGFSGGAATATVRYVPINATGSLGSWTTATTLPSPLFDHVAAVNKGFIYITGGFNTDATSTVLYVPINATGSLGTWTATAPLLDKLSAHSAAVDNGLLYVAGGDSPDGETSTVTFAPINANGTLGSWGATASMQNELEETSPAISNGYLYVTGGGIANEPTSTVQFAPLASRTLYWGAEVPAGRATGTYTGTVTYTAVFHP